MTVISILSNHVFKLISSSASRSYFSQRQMLQGSLLTYEFVLEGGPEDSPNIGL
jgi:hypothetical protein